MAAKLQTYVELSKLAERLRDDLNTQKFLLLYAHNGTGKTRLSMEFKEKGKKKNGGDPDTFYFNAFTEDLFYWDNDLPNDAERCLRFNADSNFFGAFQQLEIDNRVRPFLQRYTDFDFRFDYEDPKIIFSRERRISAWENGEKVEHTQIVDHIKISRGEENVFIWCIFLAFCELAIDGAETYKWVKYIYIDDPISSLDENNAIAVACDLAQLLKKTENTIGTVISTHHSLFYNVMFNELKNSGKTQKRYFLHRSAAGSFTLQATDDTPFFHHVALLSELKRIVDLDDLTNPEADAEKTKYSKISTYHFNVMRNIMEKTSSFLGYNDFSVCFEDMEDKQLFERALNLLSHGNYSIFEPKEMLDDTKELFKQIFRTFLEKYKFHLPVILQETNPSQSQNNS
jgi:hypothetical protein